MQTRRVLSIGQCAADHYSIATVLQERFAVEVTPAATEAEAVDLLRTGDYALVLVNRIFDADGTSGLEVIPRLRELKRAPPVMLVSNFYASQQQAEALGAVPGFGKGNLHDPETHAQLAKYLATGASADESK